MPDEPRSRGRRFLAEGFGTALLIVFGPGAVMVDTVTHGALGQLGIAIAFGLIVMAVISCFAAISGAHINPAVTVSAWSMGRLTTRDAAGYLMSQCAGAVAGAAVLTIALGPVAALGATVPRSGMGVGAAFAIEWLLSFVLMLVILCGADDARLGPTTSAAIIGSTVALCALVAGPLTGASMNPARSLGPALLSGEWRSHWIYWIAPIAGMLTATRFSKWLALDGSPATAHG